MLKTRVIPTLLCKNLTLVKGIGFNSWRRVGTTLPAVRVYNTRRVDEMIVVDIEASKEGRSPDLIAIRDFATECFMPLTVGGGIRTTEDVKEILRAGADKVSVNTAFFERPQIVREIADQFGAQCVVVSIDAIKTPTGHECHSRSASKPTGMSPEKAAALAQEFGAGEILITSIDRDGTMTGYDLELLQKVRRAVDIPVIASGGAGNYQHMLEAITEGGANAVAAASIFHFTEQTPLEAKDYLRENGIAVRKL